MPRNRTSEYELARSMVTLDFSFKRVGMLDRAIHPYLEHNRVRRSKYVDLSYVDSFQRYRQVEHGRAFTSAYAGQQDGWYISGLRFRPLIEDSFRVLSENS